eukprot:SAG31_NODE_12528_length_935_cov_0.803828_2_plen_190_part_00
MRAPARCLALPLLAAAGTLLTVDATDPPSCERRCRGARALRPGYAVCLPPDIIPSIASTDDLVWDSGHFSMPSSHRDCHLGTYLADDGRCPLRVFSKNDILNCRRTEMGQHQKRHRIIFIGGSSHFNIFKAMLDILQVGSTSTYNADPGSRTWANDWASGTLDVIFDANMRKRYIKEGGGAVSVRCAPS